MSEAAESILSSLRVVQAHRERRQASEKLAQAVQSIKAYQHARFSATYSDLAAQPRYAPAVRFFLDDIYGPEDFSQRDKQFARVVPALVRLFPTEIVHTVAVLGDLHALSERLDTSMGALHGPGPVGDDSYGVAWRAASTPAERESQIQLMLEVGSALDRYTRRLLLRQTLRMMRGPARAAGLGALQAFLERGFDTFRQMHGGEQFLACIAQRERELADRLFANPQS